MIKLAIALILGCIAYGTPGHLGDVKIMAKQGDHYIVQNDGYEIKVAMKKLPADIRDTCAANLGKTIKSNIPFGAVVSEKKLANAAKRP